MGNGGGVNWGRGTRGSEVCSTNSGTSVISAIHNTVLHPHAGDAYETVQKVIAGRSDGVEKKVNHVSCDFMQGVDSLPLRINSSFAMSRPFYRHNYASFT